MPRQPHTHDRIVTEVRDRIERGEYLPGNALESEARVAEAYGVSRGTARAALRSLEQAGLVESVPGKGWFVRAASSDERPQPPAERARSLSEELRAELAAGRPAAGEPFLSEKDVCERFGVSRYAARVALSQLQMEGLIVTVPGRGRLVAGHAARSTVVAR